MGRYVLPVSGICYPVSRSVFAEIKQKYIEANELVRELPSSIRCFY